MRTSGRVAGNGVKFRFKNIGPVTDAELELGDLTIIAGRNNTGKTYLVYTLYGFLKTWRNQIVTHFTESLRGSSSLYKAIFDHVGEKRKIEIPVDRKTLDRERRSVMNALTEWFSRNAIAQIFSAPADAFKHSSFQITPSNELSGNYDCISGTDDSFSIRHDGGNTYIDLNILGNKEADILSLYTNILVPEIDIDPFVLSAERFGISLFYKELDFAKNHLVDLLQKLRDDKNGSRDYPFVLIDAASSRYALPIKDNIAYTRRLSDMVQEKSDFHQDKFFENVRKMMDGYYRICDDDIQFVSIRRKDRRFEIPLHRASSSARGLSDFYFFLRHAAKKNHLLIIDEPESHLDTSNQIQLARLLARAASAGLKILLTTHSDYIVKEINNLVMLHGVGEDAIERHGYEPDDRLAPDRIRAYIAQDGGLTQCAVDRYGIDMPVFDETIDGINRIANDLASRIDEEDALARKADAAPPAHKARNHSD